MGTPGLVRFPVMLQMKGGITHSELCPHWRLTRGAGDQRGTGFLFSPPSIQPPAVCGSQCWAILSQGSCLQNFPFMSAEGSALRETCAPWEPRVARGSFVQGGDLGAVPQRECGEIGEGILTRLIPGVVAARLSVRGFLSHCALWSGSSRRPGRSKIGAGEWSAHLPRGPSIASPQSHLPLTPCCIDPSSSCCLLPPQNSRRRV